MTNLTSNKEIEKLLKDYPRLAHEQAELKQAIATLLVKARIDEVKRSLHRGYFIPEMEAYADGRIAELQESLTPKEKSGE